MGINSSSLSPERSMVKQYRLCKHMAPRHNYKWTELHYAASHGNLKKIQEILHKNGLGCLNKKDYYGKTALYWASYKGHKDCMEELLKFGSNVNSRCRHGTTPLHAVASLYPNCAVLLIKHGANVNVQDKWGVAPMHLAANNGQLDCITVLVIAGADITFRNLTGEIPKELIVHKEFCDWLKSLSQNPRSLQELCRKTIWQQVSTPVPEERIKTLPLPKAMIDYLCYAELDKFLNCENNNYPHHIFLSSASFRNWKRSTLKEAKEGL